MLFMLQMASNGSLVNLTTTNWFVKGISKVDPSKYLQIGMLRHMTNQVPDLTNAEPIPLPINQEKILEIFDYTDPDKNCLLDLTYALAFWLIISGLVINIKHLKF